MSDEPPSHRPPQLTASAHRLRSPASAHCLPSLVSYFAAWLGVISAMIAVLEEGGIDRSAVMAKVADAKTLLAEEIATEFLCALPATAAATSTSTATSSSSSATSSSTAAAAASFR